MTVDDVPEGLRLSRAAGWNQREADWRLLLGRNPGRFVVAVAGGRVIGTGGAACYGTDLAWVCMILVDPNERGRGLGTRITQAVLERLRDVVRIGLDATPKGQPIYARLGFAETERLVRMEAASGDPIPPGELAIPLAASDLETVLALDREAFGADRGDVLRWAFTQAPAWYVEHGGRIAGYCFGRPGERYRQIGPVVASSVEQARRLVATALQGTPGRIVVDAAAGRSDWTAALASLGFREERPLIRMYYGDPRPAGRPDLQLAIFGPEFG